MVKVNAEEVYELRWGYLGEDDNFTISSESAGHGAESSGQVRGDGSDSPAGTGVESRVNYTGYSQDRGCSSPTADRPDRRVSRDDWAPVVRPGVTSCEVSQATGDWGLTL
jgi:hypothetical protein